MTDFTQIQTKYVKGLVKKLKTTKDNMEYIENMMDIEQLALGASFGMSTGYKIMNLEGRFPKEWIAIHEEIKPGYKATRRLERLAEKKEEALARQRELEEERAERKESLKTWAKTKRG